jgi:hypothetical protein
MEIMAAGSRLCFRLPSCLACNPTTVAVALFVKGVVKSTGHGVLNYPIIISVSSQREPVPSRWYQRKESKPKPNQTQPIDKRSRSRCP